MYNLKLIEMLTQRIAVYVHFCKGNSKKESARNKWIISEVADKRTDRQHPAQRRWARARKWWKQLGRRGCCFCSVDWLVFMVFFFLLFVFF